MQEEAAESKPKPRPRSRLSRKVAELEAQLMEAATENKELGDQVKELSERVMMLEAENTRLKQMAKENVVAKAASKHVLSSRGALSPGTPESFVSTPGKLGDDDLERQQAAELDAKRVSLANAGLRRTTRFSSPPSKRAGRLGSAADNPSWRALRSARCCTGG